MEIDPFLVDIPAVHCPNCGEKYLRREDLEVHRERHRPISPRMAGSVTCPKGCKRWLVPDTPETQIHLALCDGSLPIDGRSDYMDKKWFCPEHQFGTDGPRAWGVHKRDHHNGQDPVRVDKRLKEPEGPEAVRAAIKLLKSERGRLAKERVRVERDLSRVESAIKCLCIRRKKS